MLPLRDRNPSGIVPYVVYGLIIANTMVFLFEFSLPRESLSHLLTHFGMVSARVTAALQGKAPPLPALLIPAFTSMFLHGGWAHLIGNMWFLFIFGDNVEARLGHVRFLAFYLFCGLMAGAVHYLLAPTTELPTIGASGAIAGALGAYALCWPRARVLTIVPIFYFIHFVELPALVVLGFWFLIQFAQGTATLGVKFASGGVAYWAHVGGFVAGALVIKLLPPSKRSRRVRRYGRGPRDDWRH